MPKKRSKKTKEVIDLSNIVCNTELVDTNPKCFGCWCDYCRKSLCGEKCFDECKDSKKGELLCQK